MQPLRFNRKSFDFSSNTPHIHTPNTNTNTNNGNNNSSNNNNNNSKSTSTNVSNSFIHRTSFSEIRKHLISMSHENPLISTTNLASTSTPKLNSNSLNGSMEPTTIHNLIMDENVLSNSATSNNRDILSILDIDQFEDYLADPHYIKVIKKKKDAKLFRRYFLAQELLNTDHDLLSHNTNTSINSSAYTNGTNFTIDSNPLLPTFSNNNLSPTRSASNNTPSKRKRGNSMATVNSESPINAIWSTKFSLDGKFLSTCGKNGVIKIWKVVGSPVERLEMDLLTSIETSSGSTLLNNNNSNNNNNNSNVTTSNNNPSSTTKALGLGIQSTLKMELSLSNTSSNTLFNTNTNNNSTNSHSNSNTDTNSNIQNNNGNKNSTGIDDLINNNSNIDNLTNNPNDEVAKTTNNLYAPVFHPLPFKIYSEHLRDILDSDWSKNNFLLSASMDKTVKIWHMNRSNSLKTFKHPDFVTSVKFCPNDDRFFISGCLDHVVRFWSIIENEVTFQFNAQDLITSIAISPDKDGKLTIISTFNGFIHILWTNGLRLIATFHITDKQTHDKSLFSMDTLLNLNNNSDPNLQRKFKLDLNSHSGPRITDVQCFSEFINTNDDRTSTLKDSSNVDNQSSKKDIKSLNLKLLVTSNDSRIRLFDLNSLKLMEVLKGFNNTSASQNRPFLLVNTENLPPLVICGSNDNSVYGWKLQSMQRNLQQTHQLQQQQQQQQQMEKQAHVDSKKKNTLTRSRSLKSLLLRKSKSHGSDSNSESPSRNRHLPNPLKILPIINNGQALRNSSYVTFKAHQSPVTTAVLAPSGACKRLSLSNDLICELYSKYYKDSLKYGTPDDDLNHDSHRSHHSSSNSHRTGSNHHQNNSNKNSNGQHSTIFNGTTKVNQGNLPNMKDIIGDILITTDNQGNIRIFRADMPDSIRKIILEHLHNYKIHQQHLHTLQQQVKAQSSTPNHIPQSGKSQTPQQKQCIACDIIRNGSTLRKNLKFSSSSDSLVSTSSNSSPVNNPNNSGSNIPLSLRGSPYRSAHSKSAIFSDQMGVSSRPKLNGTKSTTNINGNELNNQGSITNSSTIKRSESLISVANPNSSLISLTPVNSEVVVTNTYNNTSKTVSPTARSKSTTNGVTNTNIIVNDEGITISPLPKLQCTVCDGTKFRKLPNNKTGYYCIDCGTILNKLR
ncbi:hypothetical protein TBLA_0B08980 [Henningerozyma blattae CBS 6284]|uniref:Uncharacterized protein n=1 Tax=Henningerozyma blattae (strain ATCC 34711 / CBS 6284 / DSM 70876 / NBRC 10599 / NRRL Y-10934 / UCD 77-7) TaxID=1071380 RepID=I2H011_HENB6|nr:hypothetical protein TBLA_0B08980 [Tetrapisispora blattae CBS 6284]CCH59713.1 hypothetical protein TBLA_0B08980 [Tetrapisispora blattae CBS 6284]